jgi:hypothetical protein
MKGYTKIGLLFLMVAVILMICTAVASFSFYSSFQPTDGNEQSYTFLLSLLPIAALGGLGALLAFIGALFIVLGRKEFGEQHRKFIMYALILFFIILVIAVVFTAVLALTVTSKMLSGMSTGTAPLDAATFQSYMTLSLTNSFIIAVLSGLIWVLALYHLENRKGRILLLAAFTVMILSAAVTFVGTIRMIDAWRTQGTLDAMLNQTTSLSSTMYSQLLSSTPWTGTTGILLLVCQLLQSILLFVALYIPYKRITTGELSPMQPSAEIQRRCPTCGRVVPNDAMNCPACGTQL